MDDREPIKDIKDDIDPRTERLREALRDEENAPCHPKDAKGSNSLEGDGPTGGRKHRRKRNVIREIIELLVLIAAALIITLLLRAFVIDNYEIPTGSMEPTIEINDRVFAEKLSYRFSSPSVGDIVTFDDPVVDGRVLIKRCIAVGGQTIDLVDGKVVVDGVVLDEPYTHGKPTLSLQPKAGVDITYPYTLPEGTVWVMGDNRTNSLDSRYFGPVSEDALIGKTLFRFLPLDRFGRLD